ncbi:MAG: hypothetical protein ABJG78_17120 [Cyclobacteriaceae bacterium]
MIKTFTENDLVRFLYDEVNEDEREEIRESLLTDIQLQNKITELRRVMELLDAFVMKAPEAAVSRILYASKNLYV